MPGFELIDDKEKKQINDVINRKVLFRYGYGDDKKHESKARKFESILIDKLNVKHSHLCSSGTAALIATLVACGIGGGDEVIVPPFTFIATIEAILLVGAIPIFAEIDETLCLSPNTLKMVLTKKTKAILPVHMCGSMARIDEIKKICDSYGVILIEDACQALGATFKGKTLGSFGKAGCFSFDFVKTITCGEGGAIVTNHRDVYKAVDSFTDHGHDHVGNDRGMENSLSIGTNFRISELNAAVGIAQLEKLDRILKIQKRNKTFIKEFLAKINGIKFRDIPDEKGDSASFISFSMPTKTKAQRTVSELTKAGINGCYHWFSNKWHYFRQWNQIKSLNFYAKLPFGSLDKMPNYSDVKLPKSDSIMEKVLSIQIRLGWKAKKIELYANKITSIIKENI